MNSSAETQPARLSTAERLLEAAAHVFGRDGIEGATTREIAREAGVNEVTLFRHFKSKDRLLAAVVAKSFGPAAAIDRQLIPQATDNLAHDLLAFAHRYWDLLTANLPLVRTMIGEIQRHREHERQVFRAVFYPLREAFNTRLELAKKAGTLRSDADVEMIGDLFSGMIFMGVLKSNAPHPTHRSYNAASYLKGAVDLMMLGILSADEVP